MAHLRSVAAFLKLDKPGGVKLPLVERIVAKLLQANGAEDAAAGAAVVMAAAVVEGHVDVDQDAADVDEELDDEELLCPHLNDNDGFISEKDDVEEESSDEDES